MILRFKNALLPIEGLSVLAPVNSEAGTQLLFYAHGHLLARHMSESPAKRLEQLELFAAVLSGRLSEEHRKAMAEMLLYAP